jgi:hypothetical protein
MNDETQQPPGEARACAPGGSKPAGGSCRQRQAQQVREHGHARPCTLKSARPDQSGTVPKGLQHLNQKGAMALAKRLEQYWHDRGYPTARFWVEPIEERFDKVGTFELYRVVCNLIDGLPPRYQERDGGK